MNYDNNNEERKEEQREPQRYTYDPDAIYKKKEPASRPRAAGMEERADHLFDRRRGGGPGRRGLQRRREPFDPRVPGRDVFR